MDYVFAISLERINDGNFPLARVCKQDTIRVQRSVANTPLHQQSQSFFLSHIDVCTFFVGQSFTPALMRFLEQSDFLNGLSAGVYAGGVCPKGWYEDSPCPAVSFNWSLTLSDV